MSRLLCLWSGPPAEAEVYKSLKYVLSEVAGVCYAKAWRGKAKKPFANFRFKNEAHRSEWLGRMKNSEDLSEAANVEYEAAKAKNIEALLAKLQVGTLLHTSWGYEQTNCDFYQVIERKPKSVVIRAIAGEDVGMEGGSSMATYLSPVPNDFVGEPFTARISQYGVQIRGHAGGIIEPGSKHYSSWYA